MKIRAAHPCAVLLLVAAAVLPAAALKYPLSAKEILEAYSLGRKKDSNMSRFLIAYTERYPAPESGPHVAMIRLETPYVQIVNRASKDPNFDVQRAQDEFLGKPQAVRVIVRIELTRTYSRLLFSKPEEFHWRPPDFWRDFKIKLIQNQEIAPQTVRGQPEYEGAPIPESMSGAMVTAEFDAATIQSEPGKVEVLTPDGQHVEAKFDFKRLK